MRKYEAKIIKVLHDGNFLESTKNIKAQSGFIKYVPAESNTKSRGITNTVLFLARDRKAPSRNKIIGS